MTAGSDAWVLKQVLDHLQVARQNADPVRIHVNVAASMFANQFDLDRFISMARASGLRPGELVIEVSELAVDFVRPGAQQRLAQLSEEGVEIALDGFGRGHLPLSVLPDLPIDWLKVDASFLRDGYRALFEGMCVLAERLGLGMIVEGIESESEHEFIADQRVPFAQGFHYGRPGPERCAIDISEPGVRAEASAI